MTEFWEEAFKRNNEMWGSLPAQSAIITAELFAKNKLNRILIPGIGYGRNAKPFISKGMHVTGIEISETAINLAQKTVGPELKIHQGSVTDMPFDQNIYDGIFSYALIHLLGERERHKLIDDCFRNLNENGLMVFTAITKNAATYAQGKLISKDRYEQFGGVNMFFYDQESIEQEFGEYGLFNIDTVNENYPFHLIQCRK